MRIVIKEPRKPAAVKVIDGTLEEMQGIVGGSIETVPFAERIVCVRNKSGLINDMPFNFSIPPFFIYGTAFFCGIDGADMVGLDDGWTESILNHFGGSI